MARRVFISYQHQDQLKAKGFKLMQHNAGIDLDFTSRGLLDPVKSSDPSYITRQIKERLKGTSVTVVLLGSETSQSSWVENEIQWSLEKDPPNGLVAIRLSSDAPVPAGLEGAEVLDWQNPEDVHEFGPAVERAARAARRMADAAALTGSGSTCGR